MASGGPPYAPFGDGVQHLRGLTGTFHIAFDEGNSLAKFSITTQPEEPHDHAVKTSFARAECRCGPRGPPAAPSKGRILISVRRVAERAVTFASYFPVRFGPRVARVSA